MKLLAVEDISPLWKPYEFDSVSTTLVAVRHLMFPSRRLNHDTVPLEAPDVSVEAAKNVRDVKNCRHLINFQAKAFVFRHQLIDVRDLLSIDCDRYVFFTHRITRFV